MIQPRGSAGDLTRIRARDAVIWLTVALAAVGFARASGTVELTVDTAHPAGLIDLTGYALGQTTPHAWREDRYTLLARYDATSREAAGTLRLSDNSVLSGSSRGDEALNPKSATRNPQSKIGLLSEEVHDKGWIAYGARSDAGDWDLFLCRPDGSERRSLTATPDQNEFSPQFSRDGGRLLYRRMPRSETIDNNRHGEQGELVIAKSNGRQPQALGKAVEFPWASWGPDGKQVACLSIKGISFIDVETQQVARKLDRKGFFQQLVWSPDGQWLCGVANSFGASWSVARLNVATGEANAVNRVDCCTPDWFPDSQAIIFSWRPPGQKANKGYGWTQLWRADAEGKSRQLVYGEDGRHVYGGHVSPDGRYVLFTGNLEEDGDPGKAGAPMALMRLSDAPIIRGASPELRALHPDAGEGPVLTLPTGWEPCWTFADVISTTTPPS